MASFWNQCLLFWEDENGQRATSFITIQDQADNVPAPLVTLASKYQALCDAKIVAVQYATTHLIAGSPGTGPYMTVWDRAQFNTLIGANGTRSRVELVGPKSSIFLADNRTVDMSQSAVADFVAELEAVAGDRNGNPITDVRTGVRKRVNVPPS